MPRGRHHVTYMGRTCFVYTPASADTGRVHASARGSAKTGWGTEFPKPVLSYTFLVGIFFSYIFTMNI